MTAFIETSIDGVVATIAIEGAGGRPSLDCGARAQLLLALSRVAEDPAVLAVVLRGGGDDFCEGRDLDEHAGRLAGNPVLGNAELEVQTAQLVHAVATLPKPVIAAVRGRCVGEGLALALACDLRVLADDAVLGVTVGALGERPDARLRDALVRLVGESRSRELSLSGSSFTAREAVEWGIVAEVVPSAQVTDLAVGQASMLTRLPVDDLADLKVMLAGAATLELEKALSVGTSTP